VRLSGKVRLLYDKELREHMSGLTSVSDAPTVREGLSDGIRPFLTVGLLRHRKMLPLPMSGDATTRLFLRKICCK